jgi:hypothetical protein
LQKENAEKLISSTVAIEIAQLACKITAKIQRVVATCPDENIMAEKLLKQLERKTTEPGGILTFMMLNFDASDNNNSVIYTPDEYIKKLENYYQMTATGDIEKDIIPPDSNMMEEVLKRLVKEYKFENIQGKKEIDKLIKKIGQKKIEFEGRPSAYIIPENFNTIRKVIADFELVKAIIVSIQSTGLLTNFLLIMILSMYIVIKSGGGETFLERLRIFLKNIGLDKLEWEAFCQKLVSMSNEELVDLSKQVVKKMEENIMDIPYIPQIVVTYGLI